MRLSNSNAVDFLGLEKATGHIVLTLVDDCDWNDELQHLVLLQAKLNRYLDFSKAVRSTKKQPSYSIIELTNRCQPNLAFLPNMNQPMREYAFFSVPMRLPNNPECYFRSKYLQLEPKQWRVGCYGAEFIELEMA